MSEKDQIIKKLKKAASSKDEEKQLIELFEKAYKGLEQGLSEGVESKMRDRLDELMKEVEDASEKVEERMNT